MSDDERAVLRELQRHVVPFPARALAKRLGWSQSTLFRCVASLEESGLLVGDDAADALSRRLSLTPAGRDTLNQA